MQYEWIKKYSVGVKQIDEQHQHYFELVKKIIKITEQSEIATEEIFKKIKELNDYAVYHFSTEENLFKKYSYPNADEHVAQHRAFEERLDKLTNSAKKENNSRKIILEIAQFASSWLLNHIMNSDQKYVPYLQQNSE